MSGGHLAEKLEKSYRAWRLRWSGSLIREKINDFEISDVEVER